MCKNENKTNLALPLTAGLVVSQVHVTMKSHNEFQQGREGGEGRVRGRDNVTV